MTTRQKSRWTKTLLIKQVRNMARSTAPSVLTTTRKRRICREVRKARWAANLAIGETDRWRRPSKSENVKEPFWRLSGSITDGRISLPPSAPLREHLAPASAGVFFVIHCLSEDHSSAVCIIENECRTCVMCVSLYVSAAPKAGRNTAGLQCQIRFHCFLQKMSR